MHNPNNQLKGIYMYVQSKLHNEIQAQHVFWLNSPSGKGGFDITVEEML